MWQGNFQTIGAYRILKILGEGGFGKVFLVEKEGQQFAIKRFEADFQKNETIKALFEKEFLFLKQYPHPNIVKVFDFGWEEKTPYFVSELVEGKPFDQAAKKANPQEIISWTFEILRALHFLHQHDLCHRDIKPDNILVTSGGVKLIDFGLTGLARAIPAGTPRFMAPEMFEEGKYTAASDLYALGSTLASVLPENPPLAFSQLVKALAEKDLMRRPSALQALSILFPLLTEKNLLWKLHRDFLSTLDRPPYIDPKGVIQKILSQLDEGEPLFIEIQGEKGSGKTRLLEELKPWLAIRQYEVVLSDSPERALIAFKSASTSMPFSPTSLLLKPWDFVVLRQLLSRLFSFIPSEKDISLLLERTGGNPAGFLSLLKSVVSDEPAILFDEQLFSQQLAIPQIETFYTESLFSKAEESLASDRAKEALNLLAKVDITKLTKSQKERHLQIKAEALLKTNQLKDSLELFRELEKAADPCARPLLSERMGLILLRYGNLEQASSYLQHSIDQSQNVSEKIRRSNYLAQVFMKEGKHSEAEALFIKNWNTYKKELNDQDRSMITNFNLTGLYLQTRQYDSVLLQGKGEAYFYEKLNKREARARTLYNMGEACYQLENAQEAESFWKEGLEEAHHLRNQELLLRFQNALGNLCFENKKWEEAFKYYEKAFFYAYATGEIPALCRILINQGLIRKKEGKEKQAKALFEGARSYLGKLKEEEEKKKLEKMLEGMMQENTREQKQGESKVTYYKKGDFMGNTENTVVVQAYRSLLHISELIGLEQNPSEVLKMVVRYAIQLSGAERGAILLTENDELTVAYTQNADKEEILGQISQQIAKQVLSSGEIIHTHDAASDQRFSDNKSVILFHLRSILCSPIRALGKIVGVLYLDHTHSPKAFSDFDKEILTTYCHQVGMALENARLFELYKTKEKELSIQLGKALEEKDQAVKELFTEKREWIGKYTFASIRSQSPQMFRLFEMLEPVIDTHLAVLIQGESGTGKELLAKAIHYNSTRKDRPFIAANCGAIPENLLESELFGYKAGAFTGATKDKKGLFEAASGGTLFMDEIGELSLQAQVKLLRVLQEGEVTPVGDTASRKVDVRLVTATHQDLQKLMNERKFRDDLFYRFCEFRVELPPLRGRREDIPLLTELFIDEYRKEHKLTKKIKASSDLIRLFMEYAWPGNIRELRNVTRVGCALQKEEIIHPKDFPQNYPFLKSIVLPVSQEKKQVSSLSQQSGTPLFSPSLTLEEHEKRIYAKAYDYFSRQPKKTYEALGVSNATFFKKLKEWDLKNPDSPLFQENFTYNPSLTLQKHLDKILSEAYEHYDHQPYHVIKKLKISPGYFYKWKNSNEDKLKI